MRTTIDINDATLKELRKRAKVERRPFKQVVEETLQRGLAFEAAPKKERFQIKAKPLGLKGAYSGMSLNQLYDQLEAEKDARQ